MFNIRIPLNEGFQNFYLSDVGIIFGTVGVYLTQFFSHFNYACHVLMAFNRFSGLYFIKNHNSVIFK